MQTQPSERKHSGREINNTCWWTEFKILPSWETPSGFGQKPSMSLLTWRCTARWCLLCLEFYDLGHTHMPVLAGFMDSMVTWDGQRLYTEGRGKVESQKDEVQLYVRPKNCKLWQSLGHFALLFENLRVEVSHPFWTTICLSLAKGDCMTMISETPQDFLLWVSAMWRYGKPLPEIKCLYICSSKMSAEEWVCNGNWH